MLKYKIPQIVTLTPNNDRTLKAKPYIQAFTLLGRKNKKAP